MTAQFSAVEFSFLCRSGFLQGLQLCQIVLGNHIIGVDPEGSFELFYRFGNSTDPCQSSSQITMRLGKIRFYPQRLLILVYCL